MKFVLDEHLLAAIIEAARSLNPGDNLPPDVLAAIAEHTQRQPVRCSVETGCGGSTLVLSHVSPRHYVCAIEGDHHIISRVKRSRLFHAESTQFIMGPTQQTLPLHRFDQPLDLVLLDGPHGFPFPQLEYYYLYPHLSPGALLILDDIHIRSVHDLFRFLQADAMFALTGVIRRTAFFRRTSAPVFDPHGDGWWAQGYNTKRLLRFTWKDRLRGVLPRLPRISRCWVSIDEPQPGAPVGLSAWVRGRARIPAGALLWLFTRRADMGGWWPQGGSAVPVREMAWEQACRFGEAIDGGHSFEITAVAVQAATDRSLRAWFEESRNNRDSPPLQLPESRLCRAPLRRVVRE